MKNILVFFGKSQDFTFHAFDNESYIKDFNSVIKNFDQLESRYFNIDEIDNGEILALYNLIEGVDRKFSMLKLYGFAQAVNGNRIAGSSFGVALLSDGQLTLSQENMNILRVSFDNFSKLCIQNRKFINTDFFNEVSKIWKALVVNEKGNILEKYNTTNIKPNYVQNGAIGVFVSQFEKLFQKDYINNLKFDKIYFTSDLNHLKRATAQWSRLFKIYNLGERGLEEYREKSNRSESSMEDSVQNAQSVDEIRYNDLRDEINNLNVIIQIKDRQIKNLKRLSIILSCTVLLLLIIKWFTS